MIFITYGTQPHDFRFLSTVVNQIDSKYQVVVQLGESKNIITRENTKVYNYTEQFDKFASECDILITHGGVGSIMTGLKGHKKVIVVPRLEEFAEHVDSHQLEVSNKLAKNGYIHKFRRTEDINEVIEQVLDNYYIPYESNTKKFVENIEAILLEEIND